MTDPVYGDSPLDPEAMWLQAQRPPLTRVDGIEELGAVFQQAVLELAESNWLTRWRSTVTTAEGAQLEARAGEIGFLCPDGWSEDRCMATLVAIFAATFGVPTVARGYAVATAVLDVGQTVTLAEFFPCSAIFTFQNTSAEEAVSYLSALERARPYGCQFNVVAHPGGGGGPFVIDSSTIDGTDTIGLYL